MGALRRGNWFYPILSDFMSITGKLFLGPSQNFPYLRKIKLKTFTVKINRDSKKNFPKKTDYLSRQMISISISSYAQVTSVKFAFWHIFFSFKAWSIRCGFWIELFFFLPIFLKNIVCREKNSVWRVNPLKSTKPYDKEIIILSCLLGYCSRSS